MLVQRSWYGAWSRATRRFHRPRRPLDPGRGHGSSIMLWRGKTWMLLLLLLRSIEPDHGRGPPRSSPDRERPPALPLSRPRVLRVESAPRHPLQPLVGGGPELRGDVADGAGGGGGAATHSGFPHGHNCRLIYLFIFWRAIPRQSAICPHTIHSTFVSPPLFCFAPLGRLGVSNSRGRSLQRRHVCVTGVVGFLRVRYF